MLATLSVREKLEYMSELNIDILIERKICGMNQEVKSRSGANVNSYWHSVAYISDEMSYLCQQYIQKQ